MMDKINWDLAPEGATHLIQDSYEIYWGDANNNWFDTDDTSWNAPLSTKHKTIATRPSEGERTVTYTPHFKATRENLDKIADAAEGVKWTHLVNGSECVLLDENKDCYGYYITKTHYGAFELAKEHELKPIKARITKSAMLSQIAELSRGTLSDAECGNKIRELFDKVDIV